MSWPKVPFGKLCKLINGKAYKSSDWSSKGLPIIRIQNLNDHEKTFNYWDGPLSNQVLVKNSDVLLAWSGTPGTSFGTHIWNRGDAVLNQHIFRVDLDSNSVSKRWTIFTINQQLYKLIGQSHGGVGLKHVTKGMVESLEIPLPPLAEQRRIVAIMDKADAIRRKRKQAIKLADAFLRATFLDMFGDPVTNPKGWPIKPLSKLCDVRDGTHDSPKYVRDGFPLITSKNVKNGNLDFSDVNLISEADFLQINKRSAVDVGDIIMPMIGTIGNPVLVETSTKFAIKNVALIKFAKASVRKEYILHLLRSGYFEWIIQRSNRGGTQKFIALKDIRSFPIPVPDEKSQQRFSSLCMKLKKLKAKEDELNSDSSSCFNSLTQRAFQGGL